MNGPSADLPRDATAALYLHWHRLSPDMLRAIQNVGVCASAARYGPQPFETGWAEDPDAYSDHDVKECEADDAGDLAEMGASAGTMPPANPREIAWQLEEDLRANRRPGITDANQLDVQALRVAEEAGNWSALTEGMRARPAGPGLGVSLRTRWPTC